MAVQYIEEVLSAARSKGKAMPRLVRIRRQVEGLLDKVSGGPPSLRHGIVWDLHGFAHCRAY